MARDWKKIVSVHKKHGESVAIFYEGESGTYWLEVCDTMETAVVALGLARCDKIIAALQEAKRRMAKEAGDED